MSLFVFIVPDERILRFMSVGGCCAPLDDVKWSKEEGGGIG